MYVATSSNDIQILTLPEGDRDGVLDRFVAPINHIAVAKDSKVSIYNLLYYKNVCFKNNRYLSLVLVDCISRGGHGNKANKFRKNK